MKLVALLGVAAHLLLQANAACPNACFGHGSCGVKDACECFPGYVGADCSGRVCPFDFAFVDAARGDLNHDGLVTTGNTLSSAYSKAQGSRYMQYESWPSVAGSAVMVDGHVDPAQVQGGGWKAAADEAHFYAECSGRGLCERSSGACKCFDGYTGHACQRTACPNDCSGHGLCRTVSDIAKNGLNSRFLKSEGGKNVYAGSPVPFEYRLWDAEKQQACVCDPGYTGPDCSLRECPHGADPLSAVEAKCGSAGCYNEHQAFSVSAGRFYIQFTTYEGDRVATQDFEITSSDDNNVAVVKAALEGLPGGVAGTVEVTSASQSANKRISVHFTTLTGNVPEFTVVPAKINGGAEPALQPSEVLQTFSNVDIANIASLDITLFAEDTTGFRSSQLTGSVAITGTTAGALTTAIIDAINKVSAFTYTHAEVDTRRVIVTDLGLGTVYDIAVAFPSKKFGALPAKITVHAPTATHYVGTLDAWDGTTEYAVCSDRGICDYSSGLCTCFSGYVGASCSTQYALAM